MSRYSVRDMTGRKVEVVGMHTPDDPPGIVILSDDDMTHTFTADSAQSLLVRLAIAISDVLGEGDS